MENKTVIYDLRRSFSFNGWILLIYYGIMSVSVLAAAAFEVLFFDSQSLFESSATWADFVQLILNKSQNNGWGYLLTCLAGGIILLIWKKPAFSFRLLWIRQKRMSLRGFILLFCAFVSGQAIQIFLIPVVERLLNMFGSSTASLLGSSNASSTTVGMFLYVAFFAPVFEEILFRGLILRNLKPYGKKFSILSSSFLFAIFHGNMIQIPFAFLVGLVLCYAAVEYGLIWSVLLHIFNNLMLGELPVLLAKSIPPIYINLALYALIFGCAIFILVLATVKWRNIADYFSKSKIHPLCLKCFFTAKGVIVFTAVMLSNALSLIF